jgi:mRNA interferase MazF
VSTEPRPGEVWIVDFGLAAKQRPVLILAYPQPDYARALVVVVPLTSQLRGLRGEVDIGKPRWLPKRSAVNVQGFASIDRHALIRKLGTLSDAQLSAVKDAIRKLLEL